MNIKVEATGACRRSVRVEIPAEQVKTQFNEIAEAYAKYAKVPGFRPGRAPKDLVRKRFGKEIVKEVKERLIPMGYQEAVKQEKFETVTVLDVQEGTYEDGQPFAFTVMLDVMPDFALPDYKSMKIPAEAVEVKDEEVDSTIKRLLDQAGKFEDVAGRAVKAGDLVQIDYEGTLDGQPLEGVDPQAKGLGTGKDFWMLADPEQEFLPGFGEAMVGANAGEQRTVTVEFKDDFPVKAVAGKKASYVAAVKAIRERIPGAMDDKFFESLRVKTEAELKDRIRGELKDMKESNERRRRTGEVVKKLLEGTPMELPESVVATETQNEVYDLVQQSTYRGVSKDDIENRKEEIFDTASRSASEKVKLRYILKKIADAEKVQATEQEVQQRIMGMAMQHRVAPDKLREDLQKRNALGRLAEEVRLNKALTSIVDAASA